MILTIDAGNTRTKWALFDDSGAIAHQDACLNAQIANATLLPPTLACDEIVISNVAGAEHAQQLQQLVIAYPATTYWFTASKQVGNVINNYTTPELLGSDRWAALISAWHIQQQTCVVINAGTATTIDAIVKTNIEGETFGVFIGGMILPGIELMQTSLGTATAQLPTPASDNKHLTQTNASPFATNTANAIYNGALIATIGAIKQMTQAIEHHYQQTPVLVVSGGNAAVLHHNLSDQATTNIDMEQTKKTVTIADNLVLQGLYLYTRAEIKRAKIKQTN